MCQKHDFSAFYPYVKPPNEPRNYIVLRIEGEYATLKNIENDNEVFIALALLPSGIDVGTKIHSECFEYTVVD